MFRTLLLGLSRLCRVDPEMKVRFANVVPLVVVAACGGQVGEEPAECAVQSVTPLAGDEVSPLGFSAEQALVGVVGSHPLSVSWADARTTNGDVTATYRGGTIEYQERAWRGDVTPELDGDCFDILAIELDLTAATDDGALDEAWTATLIVHDRANADVQLDLDDVRGTLEVADYAPSAAWDAVTAWLELVFGSTGPGGVIAGQAIRHQGDTVSAESFGIATLGPR